MQIWYFENKKITSKLMQYLGKGFPRILLSIQIFRYSKINIV